MGNMAERIGPAFSFDGMMLAREATRKAILEIASEIRPGMIEENAVARAKEILGASGHALSWHPTRVRFGTNTTKPMKQASVPGVVLGEDDIFFIDIAPRVGSWEGDGGETFTVGSNSDHQRCAADAKALFHDVRREWRDRQLSGQALYTYARARASDMGWVLNMDLPGHRISDFPHAALHTGSLADFDASPASMRWILEIHLRNRECTYGAFFEDMLLDDQFYAAGISR